MFQKIQIQLKLYKGFAHIVRANSLWLSTGKMQKNFHHATHLIAVVTPQGRSIMSKIQNRLSRLITFFLKQVLYHTTQYFKYGRKTHVKFNLEVMVTLKGQLKTIEIKIYHT